MVFVQGNTAPGLEPGQVYNLPRRHLNFEWFEEAPHGVEIGDVIPQLSLEGRLPKSPKKPDKIPHRSDLSIPKDVKTKVNMRFRGGKSAPIGFEIDEIVNLPLRYARFPWFVLVE